MVTINLSRVCAAQNTRLNENNYKENRGLLDEYFASLRRAMSRHVSGFALDFRRP